MSSKYKGLHKFAAPNCARCAGIKNLHVHHKIARQAGGTDELENLITLCKGCHDEWHQVESSDPNAFRVWMSTPPALFLLRTFMHHGLHDDVTVWHIRKLWSDAYDIRARQNRKRKRA